MLPLPILNPSTGVALDTFPFHLYWNAFRNNLSHLCTGKGTTSRALPYDRSRSIVVVPVTD